MSWIKSNKFINLSLVLAGCLLALLAAEFFFRIILPGENTDYEFIGKPDAVLGYVRNPDKNLFIDEDSFKNYSVSKKADIIALGDSFTWGYTEGIKDTVEASWPYYLGGLTGLSVYNMGVGGYGPVQYYALTKKALSFKPEYLIIGVFMANDFYDAYNMTYNGILMGHKFYEYYGMTENKDFWKELRSPDFSNTEYEKTELDNPEAKFRSLRKYIRKHSVLYGFLADNTYDLRVKAGLAKLLEKVKETKDWKTEGTNISLAYDDRSDIDTRFLVTEHAYGVDHEDKRISEGMRISFDLFGKIKTSAVRSEAKPIFIMVPSKKLVYEKILGDKVKENKLLETALNNEKDLRIKTFAVCKKHGLNCIDLLPGLQKELTSGRRLYTKLADGHFASEGYKVIAEIVKNYVKQKRQD